MSVAYICRLHDGETVLNAYTPVVECEWGFATLKEPQIPAQCFDAHVWAWAVRDPECLDDFPF